MSENSTLICVRNKLAGRTCDKCLYFVALSQARCACKNTLVKVIYTAPSDTCEKFVERHK